MPPHDDGPSPLCLALITDPTVTSVHRLPMRAASTLHDTLDEARRAGDTPAGTSDGVSGDPARDAARDTGEWSRSLDGEWEFRLLAGPGEVTADLLAPGRGDGRWDRITVPGAWTLQGPDGAVGDGRHAFVPPHYTNVVMPFDEDPPEVPAANPTGVYRRSFTVPRQWRDRRTVLRVGAAESVVQVFVDGAFVGGGSDSRLPSEFDLSGLVRPGRRCTIALVVTRWSAQTWLEDQDQWWHGGLQRSVTIRSTPRSHLAQVQLLPGLVQADRGTLSIEANVDGPAVRTPGWTVEALVETMPRSGGSATCLATTGRLDVPTWDSSSEAASLIGAMFTEPGVVRARLEVPGIRPWSHELPQRYRALVILRDPEGEEVQVHAACTGFRSLEVADNELRINGLPVLLHGVNLHEHDPDLGRAVTAATTRHDLELMKAHNLNAVRAAHYPHDEHLADLCDELGLYVVDEANVESHGRQLSLCHDPRFSASIIERVQRMAARDQHHPSIIMWSLGNESGDGAAHAAAAAWLRRVDPTRPLHYEGGLMHDLHADAPTTDIVCPMYSPIDEIVAWARSGRDARRPLILCEYSHAMGNSNGSLADYWEAIESTHGLQGGFVWEWLEHGLRRTRVGPDGVAEVRRGPGGRISWGYGGDFDDHPNDSNFICDGLVSADRVPHPAMAEVHHLGRPVRVAWHGDPADTSRPQLVVSSQRWFSDLADLRARWQLTADGEVLDEGVLEVPTIGPRASARVPRPFRAGRLAGVAPQAELRLTVTWSQRRATAWAPAGHVVGHDQLTVPHPGEATRPPASPRVAHAAAAVSPSAISPGSVPVPPVPPVPELEWRPTIFRALTDNDGLRQSWMRGHVGELRRWVDEQGLDRCEWVPGTTRRRTERGVGTAGDDVVTTRSGHLRPAGTPESVRVRGRRRVRPDGWTHLEVELRVPSALEDPPRVGIELELPADERDGAWEQLEWFGDGPHECYPDRRAAAMLGRWSSTVEDTYVDYVVPQEHGHRTGLRWLALGRGVGRRRTGLLVVAEARPAPGSTAPRWPGASARHHSDDELWAARHTDELSDGPGRATYLYLDAAQRGLGTGSCGPDALERYRIPAGRHTVAAWFRAFDPRREDPAVLAATIR